jgi:hypothetical protein
LASNALLITLHPILGNMLQTIDHFKISCLGAISGLYGRYSNGVLLIQFSKLNAGFNSDLAPCDFRAFPTMKRELQDKKF